MSDLPSATSWFSSLRRKVWVATAVMLITMVLLAARLWDLQVLRGESFIQMSINNRVRLIRLPPSRGRILDPEGRVLAENKPSFTFSVTPGEVDNPEELVRYCGAILGFAPEKMRALLERSRSVPRFLNYPLKKNVSLEELSLIKTRLSYVKGVSLDIKPYRVYPMGETLCHSIGTVGEISGKELSESEGQGYQVGDIVGKTGIEKEYESYLRGDEGWEQIEIDAKGRQLTINSRKPPRPGADVVLTVDTDLQKFVEDTFIERAGSAIVVDPDTGRILAMVSKPGFDLSLFSPSISERQWNKLNSDPLHPLENRSIRGLYPPGSTFKIVTATAALAEKIVKPERKFVCKGELEMAGQVFRCWNHYGHGAVDLHRGIVESCDVYFYELGLRLGPDRIAHYASLFGFGAPTGLGLPQELPGLIPTSAWKRRTYGDYVKDGETMAIAIGQGYVASTPIQIAMMTAAVANGGKLLRPAIVKQIRAQDGTVIFDHVPVVRWDIGLKPQDMAALRSALAGVVKEGRGTGKQCKIPGINVCGKTGTSQVIRVRQRTESADMIPYHERTHAMFVAYVDDRPKKIAVVVIVEHGGGGGKIAAPMARKIICRYYGVPDPGDPEE